MRKAIGSIALIGAFAVSSAAFAGNAGDGSDYGTQPGYTVATGNTTCAGAGAFGFFGQGWNLGIVSSPGNGNPQHAIIGSWPGPGTNGTQTGISNSTLCGNRQGNLP